MLRLTTFEFIVRSMPESFVLMFAMIALSNTKINVKRYTISSVLFGVCGYGIRMLPINFGVHTILDIFVMIIIMRSIDKIDVILAIKSSLIVTIVLFILEGLDIFIFKLIFKDGFETVMSNPTLKTICGLPSLIFITIITTIYYLKKRNI